eukprot:scaffold13529_cov101-Isochrysis_galbana.AAC.5
MEECIMECAWQGVRYLPAARKQTGCLLLSVACIFACSPYAVEKPIEENPCVGFSRGARAHHPPMGSTAHQPSRQRQRGFWHGRRQERLVTGRSLAQSFWVYRLPANNNALTLTRLPEPPVPVLASVGSYFVLRCARPAPLLPPLLRWPSPHDPPPPGSLPRRSPPGPAVRNHAQPTTTTHPKI